MIMAMAKYRPSDNAPLFAKWNHRDADDSMRRHEEAFAELYAGLVEIIADHCRPVAIEHWMDAEHIAAAIKQRAGCQDAMSEAVKQHNAKLGLWQIAYDAHTGREIVRLSQTGRAWPESRTAIVATHPALPAPSQTPPAISGHGTGDDHTSPQIP